MGNKFGWHSGVLTCKDAKIQGDLYVQDDIVFSDVSAGRVGVTGGIDMTGTTSDYALDLNGSTISTADIRFSAGATAVNASDVLTLEEATLTMDASTLFSVESGDIRFGFDDGAYMKIAVTDATGVTAITFAGSGSTLKITNPDVEIESSTGITLDGDVTIDSAHTLTTGTGNVTIKGDMSIDAGKDFDMSAGAGTFATGTGAVSINGDVTLAASVDVSITAGDSAIDFSNGTGVFKSTTGENTLSGNVTISGSKTFTTGTGAISILGDATFGTDKKAYFRDAGLYIYSSTDGQLDIVSDTTVAISGATTFDSTIDIGAQGSGIAVATGDEFVMEVHAKPTTALTAGATGLSAGIRCRYEVGAAQTNQISVVAIDARLRPKYAMADGAHAGINAGIEADAVAFSGTATTTRSAGHFYLELASGATVTTGYLTGITIDSSVDGSISMASCSFWGLRIKTGSGKEPWEYGIYMDDSSVTAGLYISGVTTGITVTGTAGAATSKAFTTSGFTIDAGNLTDGYGAVEADLTMTGTATGHMAALSAWININTGTASSGGDFVAAQTNGIYEGASGTITGAQIVFGMRMDCICTHNDASGYYPFSIVNSGNTTTALFQCNANTDMGIVSDAGSTRAELCPLLKLPDGTVKYVLLYDHT